MRFILSIVLFSVGFSGVLGSFVDPGYVFSDWTGWGTSLAWFGDVLGGLPQDVQDEINSGLFSPDRLNLNILRYTIGGTTPGNLTCGPFRAGGATESFKDGPAIPYNWARDPRARKVLLAAKALGVDVFEAFSNSPPQWMTRSGCTKGNPAGGSLHDNFDPSNSDIFADYLTEVVKYYHENYNVTFTSLAPFNEPSSGYWPGESGNQEGCCMERSTMVQVIRSVNAALQAKTMDYVSLSVTDETEINAELTTQIYFSDAGVSNLYTKVNTHGYSDNGRENRAELYTHAMKNGHVLWMDEIGWAATPVNDMTQGLAAAERIVYDLRNMNPSAWVYWQAMEDQQPGAWGLVDVPYNTASLSNIRYTSGYYGMLQLSKYIKKGYKIVHSSDSTTIAAYDAASRTLVIVTVNTGASARGLLFDLKRLDFSASVPTVSASRTSATEQNSNLGNIPLNGEAELTFQLTPRSVTTFVLSGAVALPSTNLLINGDFETPSKSGWSLLYGSRNDAAINGVYPFRGEMSGYLDFGPSELSLMQNVTVTESKTYYLSARVASSEDKVEFGMLVNGVQGPEVTLEAWTGYKVFGLSVEANAGNVITVYLYGPRGSGNGQIDDVVLH